MSYRATIQLNQKIKSVETLKRAVQNPELQTAHGFTWVGFKENVYTGIGARTTGYVLRHKNTRFDVVLDFGFDKESEVPRTFEGEGLAPEMHMDRDHLHRVRPDYEFLIGAVYTAQEMIDQLITQGCTVSCEINSENEIVYAVEN